MQHILQVIPPLLVVAALLLVRLFDGRDAERRACGIGAAGVAAALAYLVLLVFPFACLRSELRVDLAPAGAELAAATTGHWPRDSTPLIRQIPWCKWRGPSGTAPRPTNRSS